MPKITFVPQSIINQLIKNSTYQIYNSDKHLVINLSIPNFEEVGYLKHLFYVCGYLEKEFEFITSLERKILEIIDNHIENRYHDLDIELCFPNIFNDITFQIRFELRYKNFEIADRFVKEFLNFKGIVIEEIFNYLNDLVNGKDKLIIDKIIFENFDLCLYVQRDRFTYEISLEILNKKENEIGEKPLEDILKASLQNDCLTIPIKFVPSINLEKLNNQFLNAIDWHLSTHN